MVIIGSLNWLFKLAFNSYLLPFSFLLKGSFSITLSYLEHVLSGIIYYFIWGDKLKNLILESKIIQA